jgi:glycosyltransferase involved in cell wall biosynthesis
MTGRRRRVLIAHVPYVHRGGEDQHVQLLERVYARLGIETVLHPLERAAPGMAPLTAAASLLPGRSPEAEEAYSRAPFGFIHLHNAFPALGPRFLRWARARRIPVVMTVHNHRFFCANGLALRDGKVCKDCFASPSAVRPVLRNCNGSRLKSTYYAAALHQIRSQGLLQSVSKFIAPSPYIAGELRRYGIPDAKITQVLNPVDAQPPAEGQAPCDVLYAGRLSPEKGIQGLIAAARLLPDLRIVVTGDGSERDAVRNSPLQYAGVLPRAELMGQIRASRICVLPSICNEILPTFVLEAYLSGKWCVIPSMESTRWLADPFGVPVDTSRPEAIAEGIRDALARPAPDPWQVEAFRRRVSVEAYAEALGEVVKEWT